ncbi:hypothetical protein I4F81_002357 [Pyropia yezoensis]|uniref:Uncharacterized protein n=1 Tax=Pyropia yezoensis TaxID=2788 RepID=A0ACC3BPC6_PYRYE|nr:hypothetical protein I4F81_002357 [Neopyropia yezoensis]
MRSYCMHGGASRIPDDLSPEEQEEHIRLRPYLKAFLRLRWAADVPDDKVLLNDDNALRADGTVSVDENGAAAAAHRELAVGRVTGAAEKAAAAAAQVEAAGLTRGDPQLDELLMDMHASTAEPHRSPSPRTGQGVGARVGGGDQAADELPSRTAHEALVKKVDECRGALSLARAGHKSAEATLRNASATQKAVEKQLTAAPREFETRTAEASQAGTSRDEAAARTAVLSAKTAEATLTRDAAVKDAEQARDDLIGARKAAGAAAHRSSVARNDAAEAEARVTKAQAEAASASATLSRLAPALGGAVDEVVRRVGATSQAPSAFCEVTRRFRSMAPTPNADARTGARASIDSVVKDVYALVFDAEAAGTAARKCHAALTKDLRTLEATHGAAMADIDKHM